MPDETVKRLLPLALIVVGACGSGAREDPSPPAPGPDARAEEPRPPPPSDPEAFRDGFVQDGLATPVRTIAALRDALGRPDSVRVEEVANRHAPGQTDSIFTLRYPGLVAEYYRVHGRDLLMAVRVTESRHLAGERIRIGMEWSRARRVLGEPRREEGGTYSYVCGSCKGAEEPVFVEVREGRVTAIVFTYYVD